MSFDKAFLTQLKSSIDPEVLGDSLGIQRKGSAWLCPFHPDKTPSFGLKGSAYRCFACGERGDCVNLVMRLQGTDFNGAVDFLRRVTTLSPTLRPRTEARRSADTGNRPDMLRQPTCRDTDPDLERRAEILTFLVRDNVFRKNDQLHAYGLKYLASRGISEATALEHGLGFLSDYKHSTQSLKRRFSIRELQAVGLFNKHGNLRPYGHRLLFPYYLNDRVLGLQARSIVPDPPRKGPKEILIGSPAIPFNCNVLSKGHKRVYITEGVVDCLSFAEMGEPAVGIPGAHAFKPDWVRLFDDIEEVAIAFDADDAGRKGAEKIHRLLLGTGPRKVLTVDWPPGVNDVNEFLNA
jgi:DNA primase